MPPLSPWFVLAVLVALPILAAISSRDTLRKRFEETLDDDTDSERAVEWGEG